MKRETKLWLRKHALMALRAIVWHVDEWIQRQEVALREDLRSPFLWTQSIVRESKQARATFPVIDSRRPERQEESRVDGTNSRRGSGETFEQWEMRKSGVRPVTKRIHRRRYRPSASEFDRSIIEKRKDWLQ